MGGGGLERWGGSGATIPLSCDWVLPLIFFPPSIQAFPPRSRWGPHSPLSPALCPAAHCDLAGGKTQGLAGREVGVGLFSNLGKLGPSPPLSLERNNLPFPPSVPSGHPGDWQAPTVAVPQARQCNEQGGGLPWCPGPTLTLPVLWVPLLEPRARGRSGLGWRPGFVMAVIMSGPPRQEKSAVCTLLTFFLCSQAGK